MYQNLIFSIALFGLCSLAEFAKTTEFTYQGRLAVGGNAANTRRDFEFRLCAYETDCSSPPETKQRFNVPVSNDGFTVKLDLTPRISVA